VRTYVHPDLHIITHGFLPTKWKGPAHGVVVPDVTCFVRAATVCVLQATHTHTHIPFIVVMWCDVTQCTVQLVSLDIGGTCMALVRQCTATYVTGVVRHRRNLYGTCATVYSYLRISAFQLCFVLSPDTDCVFSSLSWTHFRAEHYSFSLCPLRFHYCPYFLLI
jgi:hypothetical protein